MKMHKQAVLGASADRKSKLSLETVDAISNLKSEPDWMRQFRQKSWAVFEKVEIPKFDEEWRRIDLSDFSFDSITPAMNRPFAPGQKPQFEELHFPFDWSDLVAKSAKEEAGTLVQVGSSASTTHVSSDLAKQGVIFADLDTAVQKHPELMQNYFMTGGVKSDENKFTALHGAFWSGGSLVYVPKGVEVELPLHSYFGMGGFQGDGIFPHTLIVLEENSRLVYIDEYASSSQEGCALSTSAVEIFLKKGAQLSYFNVQKWGANVYHFSEQRAISEADSQLTTVSVALGSKLTKSSIETFLNGPGASAQMLGIVMGDSKQFFAHHTLQNHISPNTNSDLLFKAALKDEAHSLFSGLIRIAKEAHKSGAYQLNPNLLLSDGAKATPIPKLEIETNEVVKCTHGATVGPVDEDQVYYLMTRGLDRKTAERIIILGFFEQVLQRIPIESEKRKLFDHIEKKLEGL